MSTIQGIPRATYRLQFHSGFRFEHATALAPYLAALGISHVYASPIFRASPGSTHGYDVCDHNELNPELGSSEDFAELVHTLDEHGLSMIVDFVPNHMSVSDRGNLWWRNVLEHGPSSPYATFFDIEWHPPKESMKNKVLLPVLGCQYGQALDGGQISLQYQEGAFFLHLPGDQLPLCPKSALPLLRHGAQQLPEPPVELLSIITALEYLPERDVEAAERKEERLREAQIIRRRLDELCQQEPSVRVVLQDSAKHWGPAAGAEGLDRLDTLLSVQAYRLSSWRVAAEEINYRRFFDIDSLAAIRMEVPEVFEATHRLLLKLVADGSVRGVRLDHIDGLARPDIYLTQLRSEIKRHQPDRNQHFPIYVEKILSTTEHLPEEWPVDGTTGYEFANVVSRLHTDPASEQTLTRCNDQFTGVNETATQMIYEGRQLIMGTSLAGEINMLGILLSRLAESHRAYRDFTLNALTRAIREVIASFPVYRTYLRPDEGEREEDKLILNTAIRAAQRRNPASEHSVFSFLKRVLLPSETDDAPVNESLRRAFVLKFQQCSSPVAAKGVEDTALYRHTRLLSHNEVGGDPRDFALSHAEFHHRWSSAEGGLTHPHTLLATSTHDTKRSEDVRARLTAISEWPARWCRAVGRWRTLNAVHKEQIDSKLAPDSREEYLLYQTLVGTWPHGDMADAEFEEYRKRIKEYMIKACREGKINSSWIAPHEAWENAITGFIDRILSPGQSKAFMTHLKPMIRLLQQQGMINSLAQQVLKLTLPGVPDIYQGTELWDYSLVDPDNRRPVDYTERARMLENLSSLQGGDPGTWKSGWPKLWVTSSLLNLRREFPSLFSKGDYQPLEAKGEHSDCVMSFIRKAEDHHLLVITPRLTSRLAGSALGTCWKDTSIILPPGQYRWRTILGGDLASNEDGRCLLSQLFTRLPVAVFVSSA